MPVMYKGRLTDFQKPFSKTATSKWHHHRCISIPGIYVGPGFYPKF